MFVDDVIDGIMRLEGYVNNKGNLTVNIGSTEEVTVRQLAELIIGISKKHISMRFDGSKPTGALRRIPDLVRVRKTLGWKPTTHLGVGLAVTFDWAQKRLRETG